MHAYDMRVKKKMKPEKGPLADAIKETRRLLGLTQPEMAKEVGISLRGYSYWESGEQTPTGGYLKRLIELAVRANKGGAFAAWLVKRFGDESVKEWKGERNVDDDTFRQYSDAAQGLNLIYEVAAAGHEGAKTVLADLADKLVKRGGDWQRIKYVKTSQRVEPLEGRVIEMPEIRITAPEDWQKFLPTGEGEEDIFHRLPLFRDAVAAGPAREVNENEIEGWALIHRSLMTGHRPNNIVCVRVKGDSMEPVLNSGSIVGVDVSRRQVTWSGLRMALITYGGEATVKLVRALPKGRLEISAYNTEVWPAQEISLGVADIRGQVAWWWSRAK